MEIVQRNEVKSFITRDGSEIRELLAYRNSSLRNQSLAEAIVPVGGATLPHRHHKAEEIYYLLQGKGRMHLEGEQSEVGPGDAIAIPPGSWHRIENIAEEPLVFLCCCAPTYEHDDTEMES
jgi:mannose-6-phosphate isomerase-like protein (cupin superfamily)